MDVRKTKRNGMIELLRFLFCITIIFFHINMLILGLPVCGKGINFAIFPYGFLGVEFFFIISGLFMVQSIDKSREKNKDEDVVKKDLDFIKHKLDKIFPQHVISFIIIFIVTIITNKFGLVKSIKLLIESLPNFFLVDFTGISLKLINSFEWYISAMLLIFIIIYPIIYKKYDYVVKIYAPIICLFLYGFLIQNYESITRVRTWNGYIYLGLIRALADILVGVSIYEITKKLKILNLTKIKKILITLIELFCYIITFLLMLLTVHSSYTIIMLFFLTIGIVITYSGISYTSKIHGSFIEFLGELSFTMYLTQLVGLRIVATYFNNNSKLEIIILVFSIIYIVSIITMFIEKLFKKIRSGNRYEKVKL